LASLASSDVKPIGSGQFSMMSFPWMMTLCSEDGIANQETPLLASNQIFSVSLHNWPNFKLSISNPQARAPQLSEDFAPMFLEHRRFWQ